MRESNKIKNVKLIYDVWLESFKTRLVNSKLQYIPAIAMNLFQSNPLLTEHTNYKGFSTFGSIPGNFLS